MNCIHQETGLCPACQKEYDTDPQAYLEYGDHAAGIARWQALQAEMDQTERERQEAARTPPWDDEIPF